MKDSDPETISGTIRQIWDGQTVLDQQVLEQVVAGFLYASNNTQANFPELRALTKREKEILILIGTGLSNQEIRDQLYISTGTLKSHINAILRKTGIRDRSAAVALAFRARLVTPD